ncbi:mediator of RNA polymerase II transcription subunit 7 [[Candida] railenensis]|uniref:Mediator of RNA polymerase II transcription subunit 7 n=1 Tax=[Candida] railenensis TaxID=45579 RepID=A0A9P0QP40_9ASCO|nr:mediator of RNA polymerase II transcription subunit 7 [[Candida] railenensis]
MSEGDELISSLYPPPPPYYRYFTDENVEKLAQWKKSNQGASSAVSGNDNENENGTGTSEEEHTYETGAEVTGELKFLVPPKPPSGTHYRNYGNVWSFEDKLPSLKEMGLTQLYQDEDSTITSRAKIEELHKLLDSLLLNFLELIGVVSIEPEKFHFKIEDLKLILININHILNSYRPHQSRESLIMLLRRQIESKRSEISEINTISNEVKTKINKLLENLSVEEHVEPGSITNEDTETGANEKVKNEIVNKLLQDI